MRYRQVAIDSAAGADPKLSPLCHNWVEMRWDGGGYEGTTLAGEGHLSANPEHPKAPRSRLGVKWSRIHVYSTTDRSVSTPARVSCPPWGVRVSRTDALYPDCSSRCRQHLLKSCRLSIMLPHGIASQRHAQGWQHIVQVLYRLNGKQSSTSFEDLASATKFRHTSSAVKICPRAFWSTALRFQPNLDRRGMRRPRRR